MNETAILRRQLDRFQQRALLVGVIGLALCLVGAFLGREQFFRSYLFAYLFWIGVALGALAVLMLHHLVGGEWGFVIRRVLESATRTIPLMALLFLPFLFGISDLYVWARPEEVSNDPVLLHKSVYLNTPFFVLRTCGYFAIWIALTVLLTKWSDDEDRMRDPSPGRRLRFLSGPGLVFYGATATFASIDWVMSLEPHWFSTIYGIMFIVGQILTTLALAIVALMKLSERPPMAQVVSAQHFHDLGNLLLAFLILWAYIAFSQFLIIWSGNIPEGIPWYLHRTQGGWQWIALFLILFHFVLPLLVLLSRGTKRNMKTLAAVALGILLFRVVDLFWVVAPTFYHGAIVLHWMDIAAPVGIGGTWLAVFLWQLKRKPLLPLYNPAAEDSTHGG